MSQRFLNPFPFCIPLLIFASSLRLSAADPSPEQIEFFEKTIRPVFAEHCYNCHSEKAEKLKGGLRLDTSESLLKGGDSGPAIVPGNPDSSLLIKAVRYADPDLQMPPKNKKLSAEQIASLETWVKMGAPLPLSSNSGPRSLKDVTEARARHWAFQPVAKPAPPVVKRSRWVQTPVDNFVLAALEKKHLSPAPGADRRTLIRRATYDLIGLPPRWEEVEAFMQDKRPDAYARVVDRLLASPHYGERWGRYWLDVARFADTKGYLAGGEERRFPFSYTYRDYVVRAFNEDKPYDQFLTEQLAADLLLRARNEGKNEASAQPEGFGVRQSSGALPVAVAKPKAAEDWRTPRRWRVQAADPQDLAALGFLTLGRRFLNNQNDIIDDRIDVVTRGTLGLTVTCARCHDHKFDPISTKDYYALHGVFASSEEPGEEPLLGALPDSPAYQDYLKAKAKIETEIVDFKAKEIATFLGELRQHVGDYLLGAHDAAGLEDELKFETLAGERKLNPAVLRRWMSDLEARGKKADAVFAPWFELLKGSHDQPPSGVRPSSGAAGSIKPGSLDAQEVVRTSDVAAPEDGRTPLNTRATQGVARNSLNPVVAKALAEPATNSLKAAAEVYNKLFKDVEAEWQAALAAAAKENKQPPAALPDRDHEALRQVLYGEGAPGNPPRSETETILSRRLNEGSAPMRNRIEALNWTNPGAPPRAMALADRSSPANSHVLIRGNPATPGEEVPRRFLQVLNVAGAAFTNGSGRLELARAIASPENPLTARVYVNRVWQHHFGEALVSTPGDFGVRTPEPLNRPLLDFLAWSLVENGWSTKHIHRLILLSATYQQSSDATSAGLKVDADNALLSRINRQRLDFEAVRDTLLAAAGRLDLSLGGLPVDLQTEPFSTRRTLYGLIDRQNLPGLFRTFDFANPDTSNQGRFHTTVPQQALFLMNSPFVIEQARALARRVGVKGVEGRVENIQALYRFVLQRPATRSEIALGEKFMAAQSGPGGSAKLSPLEKYAQILLLSNELMFVD